MAAFATEVPPGEPAVHRPLWILLSVPAAAVAYLPVHAGLAPSGRHALFVLLLSASLWVSGALPAFAVSLLAIALQVALLGDPAGAFAAGDPRRWEMFVAPWASPVMWLFLAGLTLASAAASTGLDRRLAMSVLGVVGHTPRRVLMGVMAVRPQAVGESFNASDPPVNWHTFWSYYGRMAGRKPRHIPMPIAKLFAIISDALKLDLALSRVRLKIYVREMIYPMDKAQKLFGYQARVSLDEGMKQSEAWLRQEGHLQ
jgi:hypothetical protein